MDDVKTAPEEDRDLETLSVSGPDGARIAFRRRSGRGPGLFFLGGLRSDMTSAKSRAIDAFAKDDDRACLRFDYFGHGHSEGQFRDGTIGQWKRDALFMLDHVADGPQILVGSSLGGWLAVLVAMERPEQIAAVLTISLAADFTRHVHDTLFTNEQRHDLAYSGRVLVPNCRGGEPFEITRGLIEEARHHLLLDRDVLPVDLPFRLLHGRRDQDVPWSVGLDVAERVRSDDVRVTIIKDGTHQLDRPSDLGLIRRELADLTRQLSEQ